MYSLRLATCGSLRCNVTDRTDLSPSFEYSEFALSTLDGNVLVAHRLWPISWNGNEVMRDTDIVDFGFVTHSVKCPHCEQPTVQNWPGNVILFAPAKCQSCGEDFVISLNEPHC